MRPTNTEDLLKQLFRQEFSKLVAGISTRFGLQHIATAEDIVADTFLAAAENWPANGLPQNPSAWLYTVARQKTLAYLRRNKILTQKVLPGIKNLDPEEAVASDFSLPEIEDSLLRMLFAVCNPVLASEAQIALALRVLCGFGIEEIAEAFFTSKETINKRLFRAKERWRTENITLELPPKTDMSNRLDNVLHVIYLLFNEGYHSATNNQGLRKEFCLEAIRLALLLTTHSETALPKTHALLALMCFHASRFEARFVGGEWVLYDDQEQEQWNEELMAQGRYHLSKAAAGDEISAYHLEAGIAYWHSQKNDTAEKWQNILHHYDLLVLHNNSVSALLNRLYALYKAKGATLARNEAEKLQLTGNHFYFTLLGELYRDDDPSKAVAYFETALRLAKTEADKSVLQRKIAGTKKM